PFVALIVTLIDVIVRDKDPAEEDIPAVLFAKESSGRYLLGLAPAAEDQAAEREAQPERPQGEGADRDRLAPRREPLPAPQRLAIGRRQRLPLALLAPSAAPPTPE